MPPFITDFHHADFVRQKSHHRAHPLYMFANQRSCPSIYICDVVPAILQVLNTPPAVFGQPEDVLKIVSVFGEDLLHLSLTQLFSAQYKSLPFYPGT